MKRKCRYFFRLWLPVLILLSTVYGAEDTERAASFSLEKRLEAIPGVTAKAVDPPPSFTAAFELRLVQPLDHDHPEKGSFQQRIWLSHRAFQAPVVLDTEGYAAKRNTVLELAGFLQANHLTVEHRYFGVSRPEKLEWKYLTTAQAAADHHRVVEVFKKIYPGKWVAAGISKGGQTALHFRYYYPDDVDVTVAYVAPLNFGVEDPRIERFLEQVGDEADRAKIRAFQLALLHHREEILPMLEAYGKKKKYTFSMGAEAVFDFSVCEYPFAFWQWGKKKAAEIPGPEAEPRVLFDHLAAVVPLYLYSDKGIRYFEPFFYQACSELGYYGYDVTPFEGLLRAVPHPKNTRFAPEGSNPVYRPETARNLAAFLRDRGDRVLYLYGELDPWTASAVRIEGGKADAVKIVKPGGNHTTRIANLPEELRARALGALERWLHVKIAR